jgi:hypothetical protein
VRLETFDEQRALNEWLPSKEVRAEELEMIGYKVS